MEAELDHFAHGWALLSMRVPQLRRLATHRQNIAEICESYSLAVLHLQKLRSSTPVSDQISDYEEIISGIEEEASYFLKTFVYCSG